MTTEGTPPGADEFELTLFGPGYGESIVLHIGDGAWVIVDSCVDSRGTPRALRYLESVGVDPAHAVKLIVATIGHDHIRGLAQLVSECDQAAFSCAAALSRKEFLSVIGVLERRHLSVNGSGVRELFRVFTRLKEARSKPSYAIANRIIYRRGNCEVWSLSPSDTAYQEFLGAIGSLVPSEGETKRRIPDTSPNDIAWRFGSRSATWRCCLDRIWRGAAGWRFCKARRGRLALLRRSKFRITGRRTPMNRKYGSGCWMPIPWRCSLLGRGVGRALPSDGDVKRFLSNTANAYASARSQSVN